VLFVADSEKLKIPRLTAFKAPPPSPPPKGGDLKNGDSSISANPITVSHPKNRYNSTQLANKLKPNRIFLNFS
jgi:hypothetical protein